MASKRKRKRVVEDRHEIKKGFEVSVAMPPRAFIRELKSVFPGVIKDFDKARGFFTLALTFTVTFNHNLRTNPEARGVGIAIARARVRT